MWQIQTLWLEQLEISAVFLPATGNPIPTLVQDLTFSLKKYKKLDGDFGDLFSDSPLGFERYKAISEATNCGGGTDATTPFPVMSEGTEPHEQGWW